MSEDALVPKGGGLPTRAGREARVAAAARTSTARSLAVSTLAFGHLPVTLPAMAAPLFALLYGMGLSVGGTLAIGNGLHVIGVPAGSILS